MIALFPALAAMIIGQAAIVVDDFESVAAWKAVPSDGVSLTISQGTGVHGKSMQLDFDFHGHGGYAVVHRDLKLPLPANYEFSFQIKGPAPVNALEFKLIDPTGDNVWWSNNPGFVFGPEWKTFTRKKRQIGFAWGPLGGGEMKQVAGIEFAITAGTGGKGTVWIDDLELSPLDPDIPYTLSPHLISMSDVVDHPPHDAMDGKLSTSWRTLVAGPGNEMRSPGRILMIDFLKRREFGGLVVNWERDHRPASYVVQLSKDRLSWTTAYIVERSSSTRDYLYLPESDARYVMITANPETGRYAGLSEITVEPLKWSATMNDFYLAVAKDANPGDYPRYYSRKQNYWAVIGISGDTREGLIDEQGAIESGKGQFSIEPFLFANNKLITWNDTKRSTGDVGVDLPIPTVTWRSPGINMTVTSFAAGPVDSSILYARYRIQNTTSSPLHSTLYVAVRPFQVNPPWQFLNTQGGSAKIDSIYYEGNRVRISGNRSVLPLTAPSGFGATTFDAGNIVDMLRTNALPTARAATDKLGRATGALAWKIDLGAGRDTTIDVAIPLHDAGPTCMHGLSLEGCRGSWTSDQLTSTKKWWTEKLGKLDIQLPRSASRFAESIRANLAYILINRDGAGIQPGSRSYERSWIRDGSLTSTALLRLGHFDEVRDYINWYSKFQFDNGKIPCCVDSRGADPVPENDSQGEFIYLVAEYYRTTRDKDLLEKMWPHVQRTVAFMDSLRHSRMTDEYKTGDKRVFYGLMPQSISHEGYSAKPMHSYWDDFFALRGYKDAAEIAVVLNKPEAKQYAAARDEFRKDFYASIQLSMKQHNIDYIPGAAELGDFDATSTTIAINPGEELAHIPQP
ncbi:MAG TPA: discoidin domain-containing protein, partial [Gemmatimonadaceae bacterium]|nr:discoidin domain-containing protein [Gemmatimonadaceae bacterium]